MRIVLLAEGRTERAAGAHFKRFLDEHAAHLPKVRLDVRSFDGALTANKIRRHCQLHLGDVDVRGVIALADAYPQFRGQDGAQAKATLRSWMPDDERCHACIALHDFEAWLLPGWSAITGRLGSKQSYPWGPPETVDDDKPPAHRLKEIFATKRRAYVKPVDGKLLFEQLDLPEVAQRCPELKILLNTLLTAAGYPTLP